jgi:hypothetical protein
VTRAMAPSARDSLRLWRGGSAFAPRSRRDRPAVHLLSGYGRVTYRRVVGGGFGKLATPMKVSILIPVYNERTVVEQSVSLVIAAPLPEALSWSPATTVRACALPTSPRYAPHRRLDCSTRGRVTTMKLMLLRHRDARGRTHPSMNITSHEFRTQRVGKRVM